MPAVGRDHRVDLRVEDLANLSGEIAAGGGRRLAAWPGHADPGDLRGCCADQRLRAGGQREGRSRGPAGFEGDQAVLDAGHPQAATQATTDGSALRSSPGRLWGEQAQRPRQ